MNLKKTLMALIVAGAAAAAPAHAGLTVGVGFTIPGAAYSPASVYEPVPYPVAGYVWLPGYWTWAGNRYVWMRGHHVRHAHWQGGGHAYGHYR